MKFIERVIVMAVRWRAQAYEVRARPYRADRFMEMLGTVIQQECARRQQAAKRWEADLNTADSAAAETSMQVLARERFDSLDSGQPGNIQLQ